GREDPGREHSVLSAPRELRQPAHVWDVKLRKRYAAVHRRPRDPVPPCNVVEGRRPRSSERAPGEQRGGCPTPLPTHRPRPPRPPTAGPPGSPPENPGPSAPQPDPSHRAMHDAGTPPADRK